jgi:hypothetical protein
VLGFGGVEEWLPRPEVIMFSLPMNCGDLKAAGERVDRPHRARS